MIRRPPRSTRTDTLFPYTTLFRSTTSSMLAWILEHAGRKPNFLIGGIAADLQVSARYEAGRDVFVIEADEYDTAFFDKRSKRSEEHTSELQSLMRISYAVFCLKKKNT